MLEVIAQPGALTSFTEADVEELKRSVQDGTTQIRLAHKDMAEVRAQLQGLTGGLVEKWQAFEQRRSQFAGTFDQ